MCVGVPSYTLCTTLKPGAHGGQKGPSYFLELQLQVDVNHYKNDLKPYIVLLVFKKQGTPPRDCTSKTFLQVL